MRMLLLSPTCVATAGILTLPVWVGHSCPTPLICVARAPSPAKPVYQGTASAMPPLPHNNFVIPSEVEEPAFCPHQHPAAPHRIGPYLDCPIPCVPSREGQCQLERWASPPCA
jgi:hypothetical protein